MFRIQKLIQKKNYKLYLKQKGMIIHSISWIIEIAQCRI